MKKAIILPVFFAALFFYSSCKPAEDNQYHNVHGVIIQMNDNDEALSLKDEKPHKCNTVLIQDVKNDSLFLKLSTCDEEPLITDEWFHNKQIGDSVYFDYIKKDRFFKVNPDHPVVPTDRDEEEDDDY